MSYNQIEVLIFQTDGNVVQKTIDNTIDAFHKEMNCDTFEGYSGTQLGHLYGLDVFCDGNGKIEDKQDTITGIFVRDGKVVDTFVGPLLICRHDDEGDSTSVNVDDILNVSAHMAPGDILKVPDGYRFKPAENILVLAC